MRHILWILILINLSSAWAQSVPPVPVADRRGKALSSTKTTGGYSILDASSRGIVMRTHPAAYSDGTSQIISLDSRGFTALAPFERMMASWGRSFLGTSNAVGTGSTAEVGNLLIRNPVGSGVNCHINYMEFDPTVNSNLVIYRLYIDPTVTANGTAVTLVGGRQTSQATALCLATTAPTVSANGTRFKHISVPGAASEVIHKVNFGLMIEPNHSLLVTVVQAGTAAGNAGSINFSWAELDL